MNLVSRMHLCLVTGLILTLVPTLLQAQPKTDTWLLDYAGKSSNAAMSDARMTDTLHRSIPEPERRLVQNGLSGPPDPVRVSQNRYVVLSACAAHYCLMKALLWLDTQENIGISAIWGDTERDGADGLRLISNTTLADGLPPSAAQAIGHWLNSYRLQPKRIVLADAKGTEHLISNNVLPQPARFTPNSKGPSFDCTKASSRIEQTICNDADLARLDLEMNQLFHDIKNASATQPAQTQLIRFQNNWIQARNRTCSNQQELVKCLKNSYGAQMQALSQWVPKP